MRTPLRYAHKVPFTHKVYIYICDFRAKTTFKVHSREKERESEKEGERKRERKVYILYYILYIYCIQNTHAHVQSAFECNFLYIILGRQIQTIGKKLSSQKHTRTQAHTHTHTSHTLTNTRMRQYANRNIDIFSKYCAE